MFDSLLGSKFSKKCKYCVKCINSRVVLIRKKKQATVKFLKKDVADLLANGHDSIAFGRIEALIVEINLTSCYDMIEKYCQCILDQLPCLQKQRECPEEAIEAVATLIFATARFSDLPELFDLRRVFTERYGNHMESYVNAEFVEKLQKKSFSTDRKIRLMQEIAEEFSISWDSKAFRQRQTNPPAPSSDQAKSRYNNNGQYSHAEINQRNTSVSQRKEAAFDVAAQTNGRNAAAVLNAAASANRRKEAMFNADVATNERDSAVLSAGGSFNGRKEAVLNAGGSFNGRKEVILNAGGSFNGRKEVVLNAGGSFNGRKEVVLDADIAVNGRTETAISSGTAVIGRDRSLLSGGSFNGRKEVVLDVGGSFNGRKEVDLNADIAVNGRKETGIDSAFGVNRSEAVLSAGADQELTSKVKWETPRARFLQRQQVQTEPRDIYVIPSTCNDRSHDPVGRTGKAYAAAEETKNSEPGCGSADGYAHVKASQNYTHKDYRFTPKLSLNGIRKDADGYAHSRSPIAQEGPGLIGLEKQSVAPTAISRDMKSVNMIPPYAKLKGFTNGSDAMTDSVPVYDDMPGAKKVLEPTCIVQERNTLPVKNSRGDANMIPPYTKLKGFTNGSDAMTDYVRVYDDLPGAEKVLEPTSIVRERTTLPVKNSRGNARPMNMIPPPYTKPNFRNSSTPSDDSKLTDVPISAADYEMSNGSDKARPVSVRRRLPKTPSVIETDSSTDNAKPIIDDSYGEFIVKYQRKAAEEEVHGQRRHGGRSTTTKYKGVFDEEEVAMDRLLVHYSKKGMNIDPRKRRTRTGAPPEEPVVGSGRGAVEHYDDRVHHVNGSSTTETARHRPDRVASLPTVPVIEVGVGKGPARVTSMHPDFTSSNGGQLHPTFPDYDDLTARFIALKNS